MLETLLLQKSSSILERWFSAILETYPEDAKRFLKKQKDRFANPVGTTLSREMENLFREVLRGWDVEKLSPVLDRLIRIRAVQEFSPSQALSFLFALKGIVRSEAEKEVREKGLSHELSGLESRIDDLVLLAFDLYMGCREKIFEIRVYEAKHQVSRLLERAGLTCEIPDGGAGPDPKDGSVPSTV